MITSGGESYEFLTGMFVFVVIAIIFAVIIVVAVNTYANKKISERESLPISESYAKVLSKEPTRYLESILFELENGERIYLNAKIPNKIVIGDEGLLSYQADWIVNFKRNIGDESVSHRTENE